MADIDEGAPIAVSDERVRFSGSVTDARKKKGMPPDLQTTQSDFGDPF